MWEKCQFVEFNFKILKILMIERPRKINFKPIKSMHCIKIILSGNIKTGKSCIAQAFCNNTFIKKYEPTVAIDYHNKVSKAKGSKSKYVNVNI
jgi:GTPase SAR1 family protein